MAYSYDEMQGTPTPAHEVQMAGDVVNASGAFRNITESNRITRSLGGSKNYPPSEGNRKIIPLPNNPMSYE